MVPLLVEERTSQAQRAILHRDPDIVTWWGSRVECASALNRLHFQRYLDSDRLNQSLEQLRRYAVGWLEVDPIEEVRERATGLLRHHPLRAADAFQLAAALTAATDHPEVLDMVCSDDRLSAAARREGFRVL